MTQLADRLTVHDRRRTADGFMAVRARAARSGIYEYQAAEVNAPRDRFKPTDTVRVYRDPAEVFAADSVRSFIARAVTNDHPQERVTADNWRDHSRGVVMGAMRDGEYLTFDLVLMDKALIDDVEAGKRELSNGYECKLDWTPGTDANGQHYDARQSSIRGNHVAVVDAGRAGPECAIADGQRFAVCDTIPAAVDAATPKETNMPRTIVVDGVPISLADENAVEAVINRTRAQLDEANGAVAQRDARISELEGERTVLQGQLEDARAASEPAAIDRAVVARSQLVDAARAIVPGVLVDGRGDADIRRDVVQAKLGDKATGMDDAAIAGAFAALSAGVPAVANDQAPQSLGLPPVSVIPNRVVDSIRAARY